jgi:hypothetical protein
MNAIFTGRKRSGKTTLAFDMAMLNDGGIIIYDPKNEWRGWPGEIRDVAQLEEASKKHEIIVFHPQGNPDEEFSLLGEAILRMHNVAMDKGWDKKDFHFTLIVDEAVNVSTAKRINPVLVQLVAQNRPEILSIYLTFQSPKDANNLLKSRVDHWFIFNTSLPSDLDYLRDEIGVPDEDLALISDLRPHEYATFFFDGGTPVVEFVYDPDTWFRPLEYSELNANEREEVKEMARRDREEKDSLQDLFEDFLDWMDDRSSSLRRRSSRDDDDRDRSRGRERSFRMTGFDRGRDRD